MRISGMLAAVVALAALVWFGRDNDLVLLAVGGIVLVAGALLLLRGGRGAGVGDAAPRRTPAVVIALLLLVVLGAAGSLLVLRGPTAQAVRTDLSDLPGVQAASVRAAEGGDRLPWQRSPLDARVVLEPDASAEEMVRVVDAVRDGLRDGEVESLLLVVRQKQAVRSTVDAEFDRADAEQLVAVREDARVANWIVEGDALNAWMKAGPALSKVAAYWTAQRQATGLPQVTVRRGRFVLAWNEEHDVDQTAARLDLTKRLNRTIPLTGAHVSGRGALALFVAPSRVTEAKEWLRSHPQPAVGRVRVNPPGEGPW